MDPLASMVATAEARIAAPPEVVWDLLTDVPRMAEHSPEVAVAEWLDGAPGPAIGARFAGTNRRGSDFEWTVPCTVVESDRPRCFAWTVLEPENPSSTWRYDLEPDGAGGTVVRQRFRHGPGVSFVRRAVEADPDHGAAVMAGRSADLERGMVATLAGVKVVAEGR